MSFPVTRATTMALRLWTLATRFALVFFLARFLAPNDVGLYGLIAATVAYVTYALGMDMYTYTTREILKADPAQWRGQVSSHVALLGGIYIVVLPLAVFLFAMNLLPWSVLIWFYVIVASEHIGMEIDRMLIAMSDQLGASIVIFVRQALLPTIVIPVLLLFPAARHLELVFTGWIAFNVVAIAIGATIIVRKIRTGSSQPVNWGWIRKGVKVSLAFFIGTLCLRVLFAADRQIVAIFDGLDSLAAYTLAMSVGTGLTSVIAVAIHQFSYPKLVSAIHEQNQVAFRRELRSMTLQTVGLIILAAIAVIALRDVLIEWVGGGVYANYSWLFVAAIGVYGVYNISLLPHYALYAMHADRAILLSSVLALVAFALGTTVTLWSTNSATIGVLVGLAAASTFLLLSKYVVYRRRIPTAFVPEVPPV